jgi:hypothetical protein
MASVGLEEMTSSSLLGEYLQESIDGRHILLRGKYRGAFLDTIPKGYIRKFVLVKLIDDLTEKEHELFEACLDE